MRLLGTWKTPKIGHRETNVKREKAAMGRSAKPQSCTTGCEKWGGEHPQEITGAVRKNGAPNRKADECVRRDDRYGRK